MKKENFIIGLVGVGVVAFLLGRLSVSQKTAQPPAAGAPATAANTGPTNVAPAVPPVPTVPGPTVGKAEEKKEAATGNVPKPEVKTGGVVEAPKPVDRGPVVVGPPTAAPRKGPAEAKVTVVEISDFQWPFCSKVGPTLKQIEETYGKDVAIVWKNNPLSFHPNAMPAALAAMAAHKQGKFWEFSDKLFANQQGLGEDAYKKYATELGLNIEKWEADRKDPALRKAAENDQNAAVALGQGGTPAFLINGKALSGAQPFDAFKAEIDKEITAANELIGKGTPLAKVHEERAKANLANNFGAYWNSLIGGQPAPRPKAQVDPTVWKVDIDADAPYKGKPDALVTIAEFSEFQWPFCSKVGPTLKTVMEKYPNDVRIVFMHNPLPFHNRAQPAAKAAQAAHLQGKFWEMHDKLFANQQKLEDADLEGYAKEVGLDVAKWKTDMESDKVKKTIAKSMDAAESVNAKGTPQFFINGRNLRGAVPIEQFEDLIADELEKAKKIAAGGVAAKDVYAAATAKGKVFEPIGSETYPMVADNRPFIGNPKGDVVIYEFSDFQWPYCSRVGPPLKQLAADPELKDRIKVVFKHFPLSFHKMAEPAAIASMAAHDQGKFWELHDKIFAGQKDLSQEKLDEWAKEIGLDMDKYKAYLASGKGKEIVKADMEEAQKAKLQGTPSIYINGRKFEGGGFGPEVFKPLIAKYFKK